MALEAKVMELMKKAMVEKNQGALRALRAIKSAIILAQTEKGATGTLNEEQEIQLINKLLKQRKDSLTIFQQQNRADLAEKEQEEIEVIEQFLPAQLNAEELKKELEAIIAEVGAKDPKDMGKVMGAAKRLAGKADGRAISEMVKQLLA
jgi:uncharacterized protein YqeY